MKKSTTVWIVVIIIVVIVIGAIIYMNNGQGSAASAPAAAQPASGYSASTQPPAVPVTGSASGTTTQAIVLNTTTNTAHGTYLIAANGMTLYTYGKDSQGVSNCTGTCAASWPPYALPAATVPEGGSGVSGTISTITRADGTMQIIYNGVPLYFWQGDTKVGDVTGNDINGFSVARP